MLSTTPTPGDTPIHLGCAVQIRIDTTGASPSRLALWRLAERTNRDARELGMDTALARALIGLHAGEDAEVPSAEGDTFVVTVVQVYPPAA